MEEVIRALQELGVEVVEAIELPEKIAVFVELGHVEDPLEELLKIKRRLREVDRELAKMVVLLPAD
ncbi:hypothetical protein [Pyrococcus kukulkanii]|uniref:Uncharacterized protein n=1 Tax=Pyrococcus kukulkanii TaxID=1609559 RepID=A0ABV4T6A6_9EURY